MLRQTYTRVRGGSSTTTPVALLSLSAALMPDLRACSSMCEALHTLPGLAAALMTALDSPDSTVVVAVMGWVLAGRRLAVYGWG